MIPHKLRMKGFGSYLRDTVIDFDSVDSIFLIDGYTGAGKSLILDAVTYALYGRSTGERTALMSKCLHGTAREMEVEFSFETAGRAYLFCRREWYKKSRSSTDNEASGTPRTEACAYDITNEKKQINSKNTYTEVNKLAANILHMTWEQFCQIVVLPQGKIEKLLTGGSGDKEQLFTELFGTRRIADIMDILNCRCKDFLDAAEKKRISLERYYSPDFVSISALREHLAFLKKEHFVNKRMLAEKEKACEKASAESELAFKLAARFDELDRQIGILSELKACEDDFARKKAELESIESQINSMSEYMSCKSAEKNLLFRREEKSKAQELKMSADNKLSAAQKALDELKKNERSAEVSEKKYDELSGLSDLYKKIKAAEEEYSAALTAEKSVSEQNEKAAEVRTVCENALKESEERAERLRSENISERINALTEDKFHMEKGRELSAEISSLSSDCEKAAAEYEELCKKCGSADDIMKNLHDEYEAAFEAYLDGLAAELSRKLTEGEKCPVCGSIHHPQPFHALNKELISAEQLKKKKSVIDRSAEKLSGMKRNRDSLKKDMERLSEEISEKGRKVKQCGYTEEAYAKITADIELLRKKQSELSQLESRIQKMREGLTKAHLDERNAADKYSSAKIRVASAEKELIMLRQSRAEGIENIEELNIEAARCKRVFEEYKKNLDRLTAVFSEAENKSVSACAMLETAERELLSAEEKYRAAYEALQKKLAENGITRKAEQYVPDESGIKSVGELRKQCAEYEARVKNTSAAVSEISAELEGKKRPNIEKLKEELDALAEEINTAKDKTIRAEEEINRLSGLSEKYERAAGEYDKEIKIAAELKAFTDMMCGGRKMSFPRYVLGVMLDNVLARANVMLEGVLDSNYRLYKQMNGSGNAKSGLDINVINYSIDAAGADYSVRMLSGGEKFVMSVILGLAIAETVQSRAGGIEVNSLFIDEGFGTLDDIALEQILQVLQSCGAGKKIGIISHVEALEVIPTGFEVTKNPIDGSLIKIRN